MRKHFEKKGRAQKKSKDFFIVMIHGEKKNISLDNAARLKKTVNCRNTCKIHQFLQQSKSFSVSKTNNAKYNYRVCKKKNLQNYNSRSS